MKHLVTVIWVVLMLGAVVSGCGGTHCYDSRLTAVDSLLRSAPDSALALVEAIDRDSLHDEADRAYRDLLITQARYKAYVTATSDSDINRALAWYRAHPSEREKLTRAYIYKGAVMEELHHPDSAMLYYKTAEATAAPDDYFNLGYSKLRMGALYRNNYSMEGRPIIKIEEALSCFLRTDNLHYQLISMINLGSSYCLLEPQKADSILHQALSLAKELNDTVNYVCAVQNLTKNYIHKNEFEQAHRLIQQSLSLKFTKTENAFYIYAAHVYARQHLPDSAELLLSLVSSVSNGIDELSYYESMREIALARGDTINAVSIENLCSHKSDSLHALLKPQNITMMEDYIDNEDAMTVKLTLKSLTSRMRVLIIAAFILAIGAYIMFKSKKTQKQILNQFIKASDSQLNELIQLQDKIEQHGIYDEKLRDVISSYMVLMNDLIEECYHHPNIKQTKKIIDTIKYQNNKDKWIKLFDYIDIENNSIIGKTKSLYPNLNEKDLLLIALSTIDCSCIQIAMVLGYANATTIGSARQRLARKMGLNVSLMDYIKQFKPVIHEPAG